MAALRPIVVILLLCLLTLAEWRSQGRQVFRWRSRAVNLGVGLLSTLAALLVPLSTVAVAQYADGRGFGLLHHVAWAAPVEVGFAVVLFDLGLYLQHRAFHAVPWLWRLHRVHHSATEFDTTLGVRFHPAEIMLSLFYKMLLVVVIGPSVVAVIAYETVLAAFSLTTHADLSLPPRLDSLVRNLFVTPDWHRVHHSPLRAETDSNFGNALSVWDRLFRTYVNAPRPTHAGAPIGLDSSIGASGQGIVQLLVQPLRSDAA